VASLGNVGVQFNLPRTNHALQFFTLNKQPTSVTMAGNSDTPFAYILLFRNGVLQWRTRADANGDFAFYDLDDSGSQDYAATSYTQDGATGEAWVGTVVGSVATLTKTFSSQRAFAWASQ
jgi:hypothetical protein